MNGPLTTSQTLLVTRSDPAPIEWNALVKRHERAVLLALLSWGVRIDRARDLAQETWMRLYANWQRGKLDRLELPGLALTQARFLAVNDRARGREMASLEAMHEPAVGQPSAEERLVSAQVLARARDEVARLTPAARHVFETVY